MIKGVAHLCFRVGDLEQSLAFYRDILGLRPAFDFINDEGKRFGLYLHVGDRTFIELFEHGHDEREDLQSYQHFCLEVDSVADTVAHLKQAGVEVTEPKLGKDHSWQAWITDPDGNRIELHEYTPESWQAPHVGGVQAQA